MCQLAPLVSRPYSPLSFESGQRFSRPFADDCVLVLENFFALWAFDILDGEARRLADQAIRRDVFMEESGSWRHMATLGSNALRRLSTIVPYMYQSEDLMSFLSGIANEPVLPVPDENEQFVLNCLSRTGDHHGAHLDTYSFAFNIIMQTPPANAGGVVKIVGLRDRTEPGKCPEREVRLRAGDAYFMRTNVAVHAVSPLMVDCPRTIFNFAYRSAVDMAETSYSSSKLYA
jgi:hypothetical protein